MSVHILQVLIVFLILYVIYAIIAEFLLHICHLSTFYRGNSDKRTLALTFDDGPDLDTTPLVLDILREHQVRATFFLIAEKALQAPELVKQICADGHEIGSHSLSHRHAWLASPSETYRQIAQSKQTLEALCGRQIKLYRSPWGAMNWMVWWTCSHLGMKQILWSVRAKDWRVDENPAEISYRVLSAAHPGAIVLCHDAGGAPGAPKNLLAALPDILRGLHAQGYTFSTVGELAAAYTQKRQCPSPFSAYPLSRRILIRVWNIVEVWFAFHYRIRPLNEIFRIGQSEWRYGQRMDAAGQITIQDGAKGLELHFQNETLIALSQANTNRAMVQGLKMTKQGLTDIARILLYHPDYQHIEVLQAVTLMNRGIELLGFHVEELPNQATTRRLEEYSRFLMGLYHPQGFRRLKQGTHEMSLKLVWMTKTELLTRYFPLEAQNGLSSFS